MVTDSFWSAYNVLGIALWDFHQLKTLEDLYCSHHFIGEKAEDWNYEAGNN